MYKILVLFTGGTIGSKTKNNIIDTDDERGYELLEKYKELYYREDVEFEVHQPLNILSENIVTNDWINLYKNIKSKDLSQYKGIIVTHGSDTLAFTSTVLSILFNWIDIPIVITASNYPIDNPKSNGVFNFYCCVQYILETNTSGVFAVYSNKENEADVYIGTRLKQADYFTDKFNENVSSLNFGKMIDGKFIRNADERNLDFEILKNRKKTEGIFETGFSTEILLIQPYPGLNYSYYDFSKNKPKAILHSLYHSGTACTSDADNGKFDLIKFIKECVKNNIEIYISPIKMVNGSIYNSAKKIVDAGAITLPNISLESSLVKLMIAYAHSDWDKEKVINFINNTNIFFEHIYRYFR